MAASLRNRLLIATTLWKEAVREPLPKMPPGEPLKQIETFELQLVERLCQGATPDTAGEVADRTWDLVHDRPEEDPVKRRVVECHEELARLSRRVP
jgi:hypothetical protein